MNTVCRVLAVLARGELPGKDELKVFLERVILPIARNHVRQGTPFSTQDEVVSALWSFAAAGNEGGNLWHKALQAAQCGSSDPDIQDKLAIGYLKRAFRLELQSRVLDGTPFQAVLAVLRSALKREEFCVRTDSGGLRSAHIHLQSASGAQLHEPRLPEDLASLTIEPAKGRRTPLPGVMIPTPTQVARLLHEYMAKKGCSLSAGAAMDLIFAAFCIPRSGDAVSLDADEEDTSADRGSTVSAKEQREFLSQSFVADDVTELIERASSGLLSEIEQHDRCGIEPRAPGKKGKLGKLLVEFALWYGWALRTGTGKYVLDRYAVWSGFAMQTEHERLQKTLSPMIQASSSKAGLVQNEDRVNWFWRLRATFWHRKPEIVSDKPFND